MKYILAEKIPEFDAHRFVTLIHDKSSELRGFIAIHRLGKRGIAFGATRYTSYHSLTDALRDAIRLSRLMSYKSALAGLPYGGAKGVIIKDQRRNNKLRILRAYAKAVNIFGGHFITGTDAGLDQDDLGIMAKESRFMVGSKGDPSVFTSRGVFAGIRACLKETYGSDSIRGRVFAIQGLGKIGFQLLSLLYPDAKEIFVADIDRKKILSAKRRFPHVRVVSTRNIHRQKVDVFSPCAFSDPINRKTIAELKARIVAGGANNQLEDEKLGVLLHRLNILYAPDYVINGGGLISVADEYEHKNHHPARVMRKVARISSTLIRIFAESRKHKRAPNIVADEMAEKIIAEY